MELITNTDDGVEKALEIKGPKCDSIQYPTFLPTFVSSYLRLKRRQRLVLATGSSTKSALQLNPRQTGGLQSRVPRHEEHSKFGSTLDTKYPPRNPKGRTL